MKKKTFLIKTSRGAIGNEDGLHSELSNKYISGGGHSVYE